MKIRARWLETGESYEDNISDGNPVAELLGQESCTAVVVERWDEEHWRYTRIDGKP